MKSLKAEAEAQRDHSAPTIEAQILFCGGINNPSGKAEAENAVAQALKDSWHIMFANFDSHSSTMIYTMSRSIAPTPPKPEGIAVR